MTLQRTVKGSARVRGVGLHTGAEVQVEVVPAPADSGIVFVRTDLPGSPRVEACLKNLGSRPRRTAIVDGEAEVHTVEHLMATFCAMGIQNAEVRLDGPELPGLDGSALPYYEALQEVGVEDQDRPARVIRLDVPVVVSDDGASVAAFGRESGLRIAYTLDYVSPLIDTQHLSLEIDEATFAKEIAPARTFVLLEEVEALQAAGLGKGASTANTLVLGPDGILDNELRFDDEFVRHKILDLIGDLYLTTSRISAEIMATRSGHNLNVRLAQALPCDGAWRNGGSGADDRARVLTAGGAPSVVTPNEPLDVRAIESILPHRYPLLLIDRVTEISEGKFARGFKCVTANEEFFRGHFPGRPIMPGVFIAEAMTQLGGVLLKSHESNRGVEAYLLSLDRVKFRRPVVPGDRLELEVEVKRLKPRSAHVTGRALVDGKVVSEAEIRYALIPSEH
jgi:UDP-3-O-[3-hydroxymyristoyl] N-acetylglucosamine deacetylase/3-hydroxyacyl-[acyl-carrier-protein] dehydratase